MKVKTGSKEKVEKFEVEYKSIDSIKPYEQNPRKNAQAIEKVMVSLSEYGWRQPIVVDEQGVILVGHTRYMAAKRLGMTMVPVHVAEGLDAAKAKAYRLMDNRSHDASDWDEAILPMELMDLNEMGFDLDLTGFESDIIEALLAPPSDEKPAKKPEKDGRKAEKLVKCPHCGEEFPL